MRLKDLDPIKYTILQWWLELSDIELDLVLSMAAASGTAFDFALAMFREHAERHSTNELEEDLVTLEENGVGFVRGYNKMSKALALTFLNPQIVPSVELVKIMLKECSQMDHHKVRLLLGNYFDYKAANPDCARNHQPKVMGV